MRLPDGGERLVTARTFDETDITQTKGRINTLLVDDDRQWAQLMADDLEEHDDDFRVTPVLSANEAMTKLRDDESINCVVADYKMPEIDGIQFLERVRAEHPRLPFLLVTSHGSEGIASEAISAGVTDYLVKNPKLEQVSLFANRIRSAVEQYRLEQAIIESEERYRTVTEQSWDAIVVIQDDQLVFCNKRLVEITGFSREDLRGEDYVQTVIHPDDRNQVREVIEQWKNGISDKQLYEARLSTRNDETRHCEYVGQQISYQNEPAILVSLRDTTRQKARKRELQWERKLNRTVQTALIESGTRRELEEAIAARLYEYGYELVWFGDANEDGLQPHVVKGERSYLDKINLAGDDKQDNNEPSLWAYRSLEPQFITDFETLFPTTWRETALDSGFSSGGAFPLQHNGIFYGILAVYSSEPERFDDTEQQLLTELADTVAFALHNITIGNTLAAERGVLTTLRLNEEHYLTDILQQNSTVRDAELRVRETAQKGSEGYLQYITVENAPTAKFAEVASSMTAVTDAFELDGNSGSRVQITLTKQPPEARLASLGALVRETNVVADRASIEFELGKKKDLRRLVDTFKKDYGTASVVSTVETTERDPADDGPLLERVSLTKKQEAALHAAYEHGYFERPRSSSASEIAESLDIAHSTFLQHLRVAQQKVFESHFD